MQQIRFPFFFPVSITPFFCRMLIAYFYQYFIFIATKPKVSSKARIFGKRISIEIEWKSHQASTYSIGIRFFEFPLPLKIWSQESRMEIWGRGRGRGLIIKINWNRTKSLGDGLLIPIGILVRSPSVRRNWRMEGEEDFLLSPRVNVPG